MEWIKLHTGGILRGSMALDTDSTTQLIWVKLLCMASETRDRDGFLRSAFGKPYSLEYISTVCGVTIKELNDALAQFDCDVRNGIKRIDFAEDGSIKIQNWLDYQKAPLKIKDKKRIKTEDEKKAMTRKAVNTNPEVARDTLNEDFGDNIINKHGEILRGGKQ